jgi:WXG100 family type VII secretion target
MPDGIKIDYAMMKSVASRLTASREEIDAELSKLRQMVNQLVSEDFVTQTASESLETASEEFNRGITQAMNGLDVMSKFLNDTVERFTEIDQSTTIRID